MLILLIVSFLIGIGVASVLVLAIKSRNVPPEPPSQRLGLDLGLGFDAELINDDTSEKKPVEEEPPTSAGILFPEDMVVTEKAAMPEDMAVPEDPAFAEETTPKAKTAVPEKQTKSEEEEISEDATASERPAAADQAAVSNGAAIKEEPATVEEPTLSEDEATPEEEPTPAEERTVSEDEATPKKEAVSEELATTQEEDFSEEVAVSDEKATSEQSPASNGTASDEKALSAEEATVSEKKTQPEMTSELGEAAGEQETAPLGELTVSGDASVAEEKPFSEEVMAAKVTSSEEGSSLSSETDVAQERTDVEDNAAQLGQIRLKSRPGRGLPKPYYASSDESETDGEEGRPLVPSKKRTPGAFFGWITKKRSRIRSKMFESGLSRQRVSATPKPDQEGLDWERFSPESTSKEEAGADLHQETSSGDDYENLFGRPPISREDTPLEEEEEFKEPGRLQTDEPTDEHAVSQTDDDLPAETFGMEDPSESYLEFPSRAGKKAELQALLARPRGLAVQYGLPDPPLLDSWRPLGSSEHYSETEGDTTSPGVHLPKSFLRICKEVSRSVDQEEQKGEFIPPGTYYYLALLSFFSGEFEPAVAYLQLTLEADSPRARALNLLGLAYHMQGFEEEAEARLRDAADTKGISPTDRGIILTNLGLVFTYRRAPDDALRHYAKALEIYRQQGDRFCQAETLSRMGRLCRAKRSLDEASKYHQEALENWQKLADKSKVSLELRLLAAVYREKDDYREALDLSQRALEMNRELRDHREEAINLGNIGLIHSVERDFSEALKYFRAALALHQRVGNLKGEANNLGNVGNILFLMGKSDDALQAYRSALEINRNIGYRWGEAVDLGNIGRIQVQENDMEAAGLSLREAKRIFKDLNASTQAEAIQNTLDQISAHIPSNS